MRFIGQLGRGHRKDAGCRMNLLDKGRREKYRLREIRTLEGTRGERKKDVRRTGGFVSLTEGLPRE